MNNGVLFVISAPTGGGKTTLVHEAIKQLAPTIAITKVVTYTTRAPRIGEIDGRDYNFISTEEFLEKKEHHFFLETTHYDHHWYGSPASIIHEIELGRSFIIITDKAGARILKALLPGATLIWISVPSIQIIQERLQKRGSETTESLARRLLIAQQEMSEELNEQLFNYHIMNIHFSDALQDLTQIMLQEIEKHNRLL